MNLQFIASNEEKNARQKRKTPDPFGNPGEMKGVNKAKKC